MGLLNKSLVVACIALAATSTVVALAQETSPGGSIIYRYDDVIPDTSTPETEAVHFDDIEQALKPFLGEPYVYHEEVSVAAHIDVLVYAPTAERDNWTFVTSGMSDKAMTVPDSLSTSEFGYAELVIATPANWFSKGADGMIPQTELDDLNKSWPIETLKFLARFPHEYRTWFWETHTIPNGNPAEPFSPSTRLDGVILSQLHRWPERYRTLKAADGRVISLFAVVPLYPDEMQAKLDLGEEKLTPALIKAGVAEVVNETRPSVGPELLN